MTTESLRGTASEAKVLTRQSQGKSRHKKQDQGQTPPAALRQRSPAGHAGRYPKQRHDGKDQSRYQEKSEERVLRTGEREQGPLLERRRQRATQEPAQNRAAKGGN